MLTIRPRLLAVLTLAILAVLGPTALRAQSPNDIQTVRWVAGCWERRIGTTVIEEQWMPPRGGVMLWMGRTTVGGTMREFEFLRIAPVEGVLTYLAQPGGAPVTPFAASAVSDTMVTFSNPAHDFPQRVIYRRRADGDSLLARIEGTQGTQGTSVNGIDFPMQRVACVVRLRRISARAGGSRDPLHRISLAGER